MHGHWGPWPQLGLKPAAVLVIFAPGPWGTELLFTKRAATLAEHAGQISFPGGAVDPDESLAEAAWRECREEVGLEEGRLRLLGALPEQRVLDRWLIYPLAAWWSEPELGTLRINSAEVERVMLEPLAALLKQHQRGCWAASESACACRYRLTGGEILWGASGRITGRLLDRLSSV